MPRGITEQEVFEAADALLARGGRPTIERVRQELGRGSPNTINPLLDTWWASLSARFRGADSPGLPPSLVQACSRLYEEMRRQVVAEAEHLGEQQARQAQEAQRQLEHSRAALAAEKAGVVAMMESLRTDLAGLREANQGLTRRNSTLESELASALRASGDATKKLQDANQARERDAKAARAENERVREQWQGNETRWLKQIDHLRDEVKKIRAEGARSQKALGARIEDLQQQLKIANGERAAFQVAAKSAQTEMAKEREARVFAEGALSGKRKLAPLPRRSPGRGPVNRGPDKGSNVRHRGLR